MSSVPLTKGFFFEDGLIHFSMKFNNCIPTHKTFNKSLLWFDVLSLEKKAARLNFAHRKRILHCQQTIHKYSICHHQTTRKRILEIWSLFWVRPQRVHQMNINVSNLPTIQEWILNCYYWRVRSFFPAPCSFFCTKRSYFFKNFYYILWSLFFYNDWNVWLSVLKVLLMICFWYLTPRLRCINKKLTCNRC